MILFALFFALHNLEECLFFERFPPFYRKWLKKRRALCLVASGLSIAVFALAVSAPSPFMRIVILCVLINALAHCMGSIIFCRLVPGTVTAALLLLPYGILILQ